MSIVDKILTESIKHNIKLGRQFVEYCLSNFDISITAIKKLSKYTGNWKPVEFTKEEIHFLRNIPGSRDLVGKTIYRGINLKEPPSKKIFKTDAQFSSWALNKKVTRYFQLGKYDSYLITSSITSNTIYIDIENFFSCINSAVSYFYEKRNTNSKENKIGMVIDDVQLYDESEVLIFNSSIVLNDIKKIN
jgi:hypothetical protein